MGAEKRKTADFRLKSHFDDLERRNSPCGAFFTELNRFSGRLYHSG